MRSYHGIKGENKGGGGGEEGREKEKRHTETNWVFDNEKTLLSSWINLCVLDALLFTLSLFCSMPSGKGHPHTVAAAAPINLKLLQKLKLNPITLAGL